MSSFEWAAPACEFTPACAPIDAPAMSECSLSYEANASSAATAKPASDCSSRAAANPRRPKERKWTWKKPKDKPKRPLSAYNFFFQRERERMLRRPPGDESSSSRYGDDAGDDRFVGTFVEDSLLATGGPGTEGTKRRRRQHRKAHGKIGFSDLAKIIAERWRNLDEPSRSVFDRLAVVDKRRYMEQLDRWKREQDAKKGDGVSGGGGGSACRPQLLRQRKDPPPPKSAARRNSSQHSVQMLLNAPPSFGGRAQSSPPSFMGQVQQLPYEPYDPRVAANSFNTGSANFENANAWSSEKPNRACSFDSSHAHQSDAPIDPATSNLVQKNFLKLRRLYGDEDVSKRPSLPQEWPLLICNAADTAGGGGGAATAEAPPPPPTTCEDARWTAHRTDRPADPQGDVLRDGDSDGDGDGGGGAAAASCLDDGIIEMLMQSCSAIEEEQRLAEMQRTLFTPNVA